MHVRMSIALWAAASAVVVGGTVACADDSEPEVTVADIIER